MKEKECKNLEKIKPAIRELTLANGLSYPSDEELIMMIIGKGTKTNPVENLSCQIISEINKSSREDLIQNLLKLDGVGISSALSIASALEFGRRRNSHLNAVVCKPSDVIPYVQQYALKPVEYFIIITLNGAREIINIHVITVGGINKAYVHPREVFAKAICEHASSIICVHNHPFGTCAPSKADYDCTSKILKASQLLGISLLDHIIITKDNYFSFLESGVLNQTDN